MKNISLSPKDVRTLLCNIDIITSKKYQVYCKNIQEFKTFYPKCIELNINNVYTLITGKGYDKFHESIDILCRDNFINNMLSKYTLLNYFEKMIVNVIKGSNKKKLINKLLLELDNFDEKREFMFTIYGIKFINISKLILGRVNFTKINKIIAKKLFPEIKRSPSIIKEKREKVLGKLISRCQAKGDTQKSRYKALSYINEALNVFQLYTVMFFPHSLLSRHFQISVEGYQYEGSERVLIINSKTGKISHFWGGGFGNLQDFEISKDVVNKMKQYGLGDFSNLLKRKDESEFVRKLKTALSWTGDAIKDPEINSSYIKFVIALETIFTRPKNKDVDGLIAKNISKGIATVIGESSDKMRKLYNETRKYHYDIRSKIVHSGERDISPKRLREIGETTCWVILKLLPLHYKYKKMRQLYCEIDRIAKRLSLN